MGYRARDRAEGHVLSVLPCLHIITEYTYLAARNHGPAATPARRRRLAGVAFDAATAAVLAAALNYTPPRS